MPSCPKSTSVPEAQQQLAAAAEDLRRLDDRLSTLAAAVAPDSEAILPAKLRAGVEVVRQDLLSDAIETLAGLAELTEDAAVQRQAEIADALAWLSAAA
jgi:hypothetical protein